VEQLCKIYNPKKITLASLEFVDTPGLSRTHEGNATKLALIREAGCLVHVVGGFDRSRDAVADCRTFEEDLLLADLQIVTGRVERLRESTKKPKPSRDQELVELAALEPLLVQLESGSPLDSTKMTDDQLKATRSFRLLTEKPRFTLVNVADDEEHPQRFSDKLGQQGPVAVVPVGLEVELSRMSPDDRSAFKEEMGITGYDRDALLRAILDASEQMLYFTAGEKEVRTWMLRKGGTAIEAAGNIHTDLARGFIRAETMQVADLVRLGSEREIKAAGLVRQEPKDYVIRDGDILNIRFSV
jgi:ribosome-binding ATPase